MARIVGYRLVRLQAARCLEAPVVPMMMSMAAIGTSAKPTCAPLTEQALAKEDDERFDSYLLSLKPASRSSDSEGDYDHDADW